MSDCADAPEEERLPCAQCMHPDEKTGGTVYDLTGAATLEHLDCITAMVDEHGVDPDTEFGDGESAMHHAAGLGLANVIQCLADAGGNVNFDGNTGTLPAHRAAQKGMVDALQKLAELGAEMDGVDRHRVGPIHVAAQHAPSMCDVKAGVDGDGKKKAPSGRNLPTGGAVSAADTVRTLVELGAPVDDETETGRTALHIALTTTPVCPDLVATLLELGADVNAVDNDGTSAVHAAARALNLKGLKGLEAAGGKFDTKDAQGQLPLHCWAYGAGAVEAPKTASDGAAKDGDEDAPTKSPEDEDEDEPKTVLQFLVHHANQDVNAADHDGRTATHIAAQAGAAHTVEALSRFVARNGQATVNVNALDNSGATPLDAAKSAGELNDDQEKALRKCGLLFAREL